MAYPSKSVVRQPLAAFATQVRFAFKHYPLLMHNESQLAHEAAVATGDQSKFWEMHALLFQMQSKLRDDLVAKAAQLKLDVPRFTQDLDTHRFKPMVESDRQKDNRLGVDGTAHFFINGHAISGGVGLADFKHLIDACPEHTATPAAAVGPVPHFNRFSDYPPEKLHGKLPGRFPLSHSSSADTEIPSPVGADPDPSLSIISLFIINNAKAQISRRLFGRLGLMGFRESTRVGVTQEVTLFDSLRLQ